MRENLYTGLRNLRQAEDLGSDDPVQRLVFVAPHQATYQGLRSATQEHFPHAEVSLMDRFPGPGCVDTTVDLVLLGTGPDLITAGHVAECVQHFPAAAIAVVVDNGQPFVDPVLIEQRLIQGILPTSLPLEVWLAVVQLVLAGGQFLGPQMQPAPRTAMPMPVSDTVTPAPEAPMVRRHGLNGADGEYGLDALTAREREILMLVSEGYQNKLIADRMALSEHTVKAHVHNLIAKLRVTNRTQAAAYLHEHKLDRVPPMETGHADRRRASVAG